MSILERIAEREILIRKLYNRKDELEEILNQINEKIIGHNVAIMNLRNKDSKIEYNRLKNSSKLLQD